jgi:ABC-type Zn2+ transport system substrate-binding protein/surface adhesin
MTDTTEPKKDETENASKVAEGEGKAVAEKEEAEKQADSSADKTTDAKPAESKASDDHGHGYGHGKTDWTGWEMLALAGALFICTVALIALMVALSPPR